MFKKYKKLPLYTLEKKSGPDHKPLFKVYVQIPNSKKIASSGTSKKRSSTKCSSNTNKRIKDMNWEDEGYLLKKLNLEKMLIL